MFQVKLILVIGMVALKRGRRTQPCHRRSFYGLELIFGSTCAFSCGSKSVGKVTGAGGRGRRRVNTPMSGSNNSRVLFVSDP